VSTFFISLDLYTIGRTPGTSCRPVARPLPKYRPAQTQNKHTQNIHAVSGIRIHDHCVRASEDSSCLRLLGYRHWLQNFSSRLIKHEHENVRGNGDMPPFILYFDNIWRCVVGFMTQPLKSREMNPWYNENQAGWTPEPVWKRRRTEKSLSLPGNKPRLCGVPSRDLVQNEETT
jgi:hypothetical protein